MASQNRLREIRQSVEGITVAALARAAEVNEKTIRKIETRKEKGKVETRVKIIKGLNSLSGGNYSLEDIFPGSH